MRVLALAIGTAIVTAAHAAGPDAHFERVLKLLEPTDRLEQLCDYTAMNYIRKDSRRFHPDRAVASAIRAPRIGPNSIDANGGAFRSRGHWYEMSYSCAATAGSNCRRSFRTSHKARRSTPVSPWRRMRSAATRWPSCSRAGATMPLPARRRSMIARARSG